MRGLGRAFHAEVLKVTTTRMWWVLGIVLVAYVGVTAGGMAAAFGAGMSSGNGDLLPAEMGDLPLFEVIYTIASSIGYVFPLLAGTLAVTGELRHQTVTPTFLATPRRGVSLLAKILVQGCQGAFYGLMAFVASVGAGAAVLAGFGLDTGLGEGTTWAMLGRGVLAMALWGVLGVGVGALLRNQVAAIVVVLAFTQFVEPLLRAAAAFNDVTAAIAQFLPAAASDALVGASIYSAAGFGADQTPWWLGGLTLLGYALVTAVIGYAVSWRRDVT